MANNDNGFMASTSSSNLKPRPFQALPPVSGTKRKVYFANVGEEFDSAFWPAPAKKFAGDINVSDHVKENEINLVEEMEGCENIFDEESGDLGNYFAGKEKSDGKEYYGKSIVLSNEIQEILPQKWVSSDLPLHAQIRDQVAQANSMALVLWKPTVIGPLAKDKMEEVQTTQSPSNLSTLTLLLSNSSLNPTVQRVEDEDDSVEMDISE